MFEVPELSYRAHLILSRFHLADQSDARKYWNPFPDQQKRETDEAMKDIQSLDCSTCKCSSSCPHCNKVSRFPSFCGAQCRGQCARYAVDNYGGVAWYAPTTGELMHIPQDIIKEIKELTT